MRFQSQNRLIFAASALLLAATLGCGPPPPQEHPAPNIVDSVDTLVESSTVTAGDVFEVDCQYLRPDGTPVDFSSKRRPRTRIRMHPEDVLQRQGDEFVAHRTGVVELTCRSLEYGIIDSSPTEVRIQPGAPHVTTTSLDAHQVAAGEPVETICRAFDAFGNELLSPDFALVADTDSANLNFDNQQGVLTATTTGVFTVVCDLDGTQERVGDVLEVRPGPPAELEVDVVPNQSTYGVGQVVTIGARVNDEFGNLDPAAELDFDVPSTAESFGQGRYRFSTEGTHVVAVEVTEPTYQDRHLVEQVEIQVNSTGPDINCLAPAHGEMVDLEGDTVEFDGIATDPHEIDGVEVDGESVAVDSEGRFVADVEARHGINFVDITATDEYGEENVRTCAYIASSSWASEQQLNDDVVTLQLRESAIDDNDYEGPNELESFNDLIMTVINSDGLREQIEDRIQDDNPYDAGYCDFDVYVDAIYFEGDSHTTSFDLVDDGIELDGRFNDVHFDLTITDGAIYCPGTYKPTVVLEYVELEAAAEVLLENNLPILRLDEVERVESGGVDAEGGTWLSDRVYSAVTSLFQGTFRDVVESTFEDAVTENFDALFEGLMESLDVDALAQQFAVPSLEDDGEVRLDFEFGFSTADADSSRALFGLSAAITPAEGDAHAIASEGIAHPAGPMLDDSWVPTASGAVHVALLNQALHAVWRGGLFHAQIGGAMAEQLPDDATVALETGLPPVAVLGDDNGMELMLGAVQLTVSHPDYFEEPIGVDLGATLSTDVDIIDQKVHFQEVEIEELHLSTRDASLDDSTRTILETFLGDLVQSIVDQTVNAALPAMPIPTFTIPYSMWNHDLPVGEEIGLLSTSTEHTSTHFRLQSGFGIQ